VPSGLLILDRDGVLNRMLVDRGGLPESPLQESEVEVFPWVPAALKALCEADFGLSIATNQPAAAKGKATREALEAVHRRVLAQATADGAVILSSHICWHRAEDGCSCRKPKPGLLRDALEAHADYAKAGAWMVGDRPTDVLAGAAVAAKTALLGTLSPDLRVVLGGTTPDFTGGNLEDFTRFLLMGRAL
jgi:D-glycero-D-manno-heptose 1,7-bisphosphate phosphatase